VVSIKLKDKIKYICCN